MAGGRGLSFEEKRVKMLEILHETKDFFQLKELEKLGAKKGVVSQTVKDVLQALVDDHLIELDKIGTSNFYWSFPSARGAALNNKLAAAKEDIAALEAREVELAASIQTSRDERPETEERTALLAQWTALQAAVASAKTELDQFTNSGGIDAKKRGVLLAKEAAHRWTDNLQIALSYTSNLCQLPTDEIRKQFAIPDDFEDLPPS